MFRHHRTDDTGKQNHHHHTVEHIVAHQIYARCHLQSHAYHHHCDGTGSMGRSQSEHHIAIGLRESEDEARDIGCSRFSKGTEEDDKRYNPYHFHTGEQGAHVDEHTHTYQEVGDKQGVSDKLDAIHQWRHLRDIPI